MKLHDSKIVDRYAWPSWARMVASPADPIEHNEAAIERLMQEIHPYIVDVKGLRSQFNAHNSVSIIDFATLEEKKEYDTAWDRYCAEKAKIEGTQGENEGQSRFAILAQFTKFRQAAEAIRAEHIADFLHDSWTKHLNAGVAACCFKTTISKVVGYLINKHGYNRNDISLIWGGIAKKRKVKKKKSDIMSASQLASFTNIATMSGMTPEEVAELIDAVEETVEEKINQDIDPLLRLGAQSREARQSEIDRFQAGKTKFCIFTFKSGGVGLSLHHSDELTKYKVKRKESGYYVEEDIPNCTEVRPRRTILTPTYSAIELVQGLGRCPRITSMSDTSQVIVFYRGTIEERVALTVSQKLKCLKKVVRQKESWESIILDQNGRTTESLPDLPRLLDNNNNNNNSNVTDDEDDDIFGDEEGDDD